MRLLGLLTRPFPPAVIASVLTALLLAPRPQVLHERTVVQRIPGTDRTVTVVQKVCDTSTIERLLNEVLRSQGRTGEAHVPQSAATHSAQSRSAAAADVDNSTAENIQEGDNSSDVDQRGDARSGDVILGQVIRALAVCGTVTINANNRVEHSTGRSGDAEVHNESGSLSLPTPSPHRRPKETASPSPSPSSSPSPSPTAS